MDLCAGRVRPKLEASSLGGVRLANVQYGVNGVVLNWSQSHHGYRSFFSSFFILCDCAFFLSVARGPVAGFVSINRSKILFLAKVVY